MLFLSWRQLMARKKQTFLILLGISFGTLLFVGISGVQLGMRHYIAEQLLNNTAHIIIKGAERNIEVKDVSKALYQPSEHVGWVTKPSGLREESRLENYAGWYDVLKNDPKVRDFSPRLTTNVVLSTGKFNSAVALIGTVPDRQVKISSIEKYMIEGSFLDLKGGNNIILLSGVAKDLGVKKDQYIRASYGSKQRSFRVAGIAHFGNDQVDKSMAFANLTDVQVLSGSPGRVNQIAVALFDIEQSEKVAAEWRLLARDKVQDWQEANQAFMEMIRVQDFVRYFITIAILVVASFGIYNVLSIMINQKKKEIAILRAIGYGPKKILQLVLYQGIILGVSGGILGLMLGFLLCVAVESVELSIEIGGSHHLWISYAWHIYVTGFVAAICSSLLASYIPARAASNMTPMDIIRSE